jgi:hypothetical protein
MGTIWFRGVYRDSIVVVATHTLEARNDCRRIGLSKVGSQPNLSGFSHRVGFLADGITVWYEKPDPAAVARRLAEQQFDQHRQQDIQGRQIIEAAEQERTAVQEATRARVEQREHAVTQTLAELQLVLDASMTLSAHESADRLVQEQQVVAHARARRLEDMTLRAAELQGVSEQQEQEENASGEAQHDLAHALSLYQSRLDELEAAVAGHFEAEIQRLADEARANEMERAERLQMQTHIRY